MAYSGLATLLGIIGTAVAISLTIWYMNSRLKKSMAKGETFADFDVSGLDGPVKKDFQTDLIRALSILL